MQKLHTQVLKPVKISFFSGAFRWFGSTRQTQTDRGAWARFAYSTVRTIGDRGGISHQRVSLLLELRFVRANVLHVHFYPFVYPGEGLSVSQKKDFANTLLKKIIFKKIFVKINETKWTNRLYKFLYFGLKPKHFKVSIHQLVATHDRVMAGSPTVHQRPSTGFSGLEKFQIFFLLVVLGWDFIVDYIDIIYDSFC